jgi:1-aminocyclopropane-1-carboxylate deaminase
MLFVPEISTVSLSADQVKISVLRLDKIHKLTGGNKIYKLKYNLKEAINQGFDTVVTMGGAFSNHIAATASTCKEHGLHSIGIIRGEPESASNITLTRARENGMELRFVSREQYRNYRENGMMKKEFSNCFCIPEGGNNEEGVKGCEEILPPEAASFDIVAVACGTGATLAGITRSLGANQQSLGISVLKENDGIIEGLSHWLNESDQKKYYLNESYHFGGYAKVKPALLSFVERFNVQNDFRIEPIYTGKLFFALEDLVNQGHFKTGTKILAIHTGGLQYLTP